MSHKERAMARFGGDPNDNRDAVDQLVERLAGEFGGCTEFETTGAWVDANGELVTEPGFAVETVGVDSQQVFKQIVTDAKEELNEDAVMVTFEEVDSAMV